MPAQKSPAPLLAYFTAFFYILFSLIPDSHSMMVAWSWVFVWQIGLFCPLIWFLVQLWDNRRLYLLGNGFDIFITLVAIALGISTIGAEFHQQAAWYSLAALGFIAALYPVSRWLNNPVGRYRIFLGQGYLSLAFVAFSLALWFSQTFLPEINRLRDLGLEGDALKFDFSVLTLRNWAPVGHQNYVAGYLILCLPMLLGLATLHRDWRRWLWLTGVAIAGIDLYTTSSRGGWLGLAVSVATAFILAWNFSQIRKFWLTLFGVLSTGILAIFILANNRLYNLIAPLLRGEFEELNYRWVNAQVGWYMGVSHWFTGVGLGNVTQLYQNYRPAEAGRLSEIIYQLHSTPVQLWAEMGIWGIGLFLGSLLFLGWLLWRLRHDIEGMSREDRILLGSIYTGFVGYWALSLTDYQLDNVCISGIIVILTAILAAIARGDGEQPSLPANPNTTKLFTKPRFVALGLLGFYAACAMWVIPIHSAWEKSSDGFTALTQKEPDYNRFITKLQEAHQLTPWEPYYTHQLGWNLGELALQTADPERRAGYLEEAIAWFEKSNQLSPHREFGRTNLGWLYLATGKPDAATAEFLESVRLIPAKRGVFFALGLSLLEQQKQQEAIEAIALEIVRDPVFMTSPIWRAGGLVQLYPAVAAQVMKDYGTLIEQYPDNPLFHQCRGAIAWWIGDFDLAQKELTQYGSPKTLEILTGEANTDTAIGLLKSAWAAPTPEKRLEFIDQAWSMATTRELDQVTRQDFLLSMAQAKNFDEWLRAYSPVLQYRRERSGFNVISRHIDGPIPSDFWTVVENTAITTWFGEVFPSVVYQPALDNAIQPLRTQLVETIRGNP